MTTGQDADSGKWNLRLYTAGQSPKSLAALANLKRVCDEHLAGQYSIEVVDLLKNPRLAKDDQIVAIPTLVRKLNPTAAHRRRPVRYRAHAGGLQLKRRK